MSIGDGELKQITPARVRTGVIHRFTRWKFCLAFLDGEIGYREGGGLVVGRANLDAIVDLVNGRVRRQPALRDSPVENTEQINAARSHGCLRNERNVLVVGFLPDVVSNTAQSGRSCDRA